MSVTLQEDHVKDIRSYDIEELHMQLLSMKNLEAQAAALISRFENK